MLLPVAALMLASAVALMVAVAFGYRRTRNPGLLILGAVGLGGPLVRGVVDGLIPESVSSDGSYVWPFSWVADGRISTGEVFAAVRLAELAAVLLLLSLAVTLLSRRAPSR